VTAEIAILNKLGVALAADSAVTVEAGSHGEVKKIYNTTNKLFSLSKYQPVGVMVYGSAQLLRVPWEVIIKVYREGLGSRHFATLREYSDDLVAFLHRFFKAADQESYFFRVVAGYFHNVILSEIDANVKKVTDEKRRISKAQIAEITREVIASHHRQLDELETLACFPRGFGARLRNKYATVLERAIREFFAKLPVKPTSHRQLHAIAERLFTSDIFFSSETSGVVVAGFGENEIFPSLYSISVNGVVGGRLKHKVAHNARISAKQEAMIIPFAQQEMVVTFMEGIDPEYQELMQAYLKEVFAEYPEQIIKAMPVAGLKGDADRKVRDVLIEHGKRVLDKLEKNLVEYRRKRYTDPVISTVGALPKDELAAMAESLVNLTSFKRRVSMDAETVGGPIDVALISKGDGFVWIRRKHYFTPELNHQFFANYYGTRKTR
jgi:hypothetical protein